MARSITGYSKDTDWILNGDLTFGGFLTAGPGELLRGRFIGILTYPGPPSGGAFRLRDWLVDSTGAIFMCVVAGSPGTWVTGSGGGGGGGGEVTPIPVSTNTTASYGSAYLVDTTLGDVTMTLQNAVAGAQRPIWIKKIDGSLNEVTVVPSSGTIDSIGSIVLTITDNSYTFISDAPNWFVF